MSQPAQTPPQPAQQPAPQAPGTSYPGYPAGYPYYSYPGYYQPYYPSATPPQPPRSPSERPGKPGAARIRTVVIGALAVVLTGAAIAAAAAGAFASQTVPPPTSGGLQPIYSQQLANDTANWQGCSFQQGGLFADGSSADGAICTFVPSTQHDYLSQGFQLSAVLAPAEDVAAQEQGMIALGRGSGADELFVSQMGNYELTDGGTSPLARGATIAWHTDGSLSNTITLHFDGASDLLDLYINGQHVFQHTLTLDQGTAVSLGAPSGTQALFTSFALYGTTVSS